MEESWKDLPGYEAIQVSNLGRVRKFGKFPGGFREISTFKKYGKYQYMMFTLSVKHATVAFYVHRVVWELFVGPIPENIRIDHINGCPWDNRLENLRLATSCQNSQNQKCRQDRKFKGVYDYYSNGRVTGKFRAAICASRKQVHLGVFATELEAAKAYNDAARSLHGQFAKLNPIEDA